MKRIKRKLAAARNDHEVAEAFPRTEEGAAMRNRYMIEKGLALTANKDLDIALVKKCLREGLVERVGRFSSLVARADGEDLEAKMERIEGFAYHLRVNVQADIMLAIVSDLTDDKGDILVTDDHAKAIGHAYQDKIYVTYYAIPKPLTNESREYYSQWLSELLEAWGYAVAREEIVNGECRRCYATCPDVAPHVKRVVAARKVDGKWSSQ